jgi:4,5-DOPA dioxygenase extradiol
MSLGSNHGTRGTAGGSDAWEGPLPVLFLSHGAPDLALASRPAARFLRRLGQALPRPERIVVVSAHWSTAPVGVTGALRPGTIHDFYGFPDPLYDLEYRPPGDPALAELIAGTLNGAGIETRIDLRRGLDHGAWVPLLLLYPEAEIPTVQVALPPGGVGALLPFGQALGALRDGRTLLLFSGGTVHNLRAIDPSGATAPWAARFERWVHERVEGGELAQLADAARHTPDFSLAHPTFEHLAPLFAAWAAGDPARPGRSLFSGFEYGNIGMGCFAFPA